MVARLVAAVRSGDIASFYPRLALARFFLFAPNLPVELKVVESPIGESLEIELLVSVRAGVAAARERARVAVDAGDEALFPHEAREPRKAVRELDRVPFHGAVGRTVLGRPSVVQVEAIVAGSQQAVVGHGVGGVDKDALANVGHVSSPVVESHGRQREPLRVRPGLSGADEAGGRYQSRLCLHGECESRQRCEREYGSDGKQHLDERPKLKILERAAGGILSPRLLVPPPHLELQLNVALEGKVKQGNKLAMALPRAARYFLAISFGWRSTSPGFLD